jgi:hypothetical protein
MAKTIWGFSIRSPTQSCWVSKYLIIIYRYILGDELVIKLISNNAREKLRLVESKNVYIK